MKCLEDKIKILNTYKCTYIILLFLLICFGCQNVKNNDSISRKSEEISGEYYDWTITQKPEKPWIKDYGKTLVMKFFMCERDSIGEIKRVYMNYQDALEIIKKIDNFTLGLPKIIYLVGWQYNGHDSKYPSWDKFNEALKRPEDSSAYESFKWLTKEAKSYNTIISLHINMIDAYKDSPLWNEYYEQNIIAKDSIGNLIEGEVFGGIQSYQISYTQEWQLGYAQKRIDNLLDMIPELYEAGTIHIDAFHSMRPSGPHEPISPYLGFTIEDEIATQRKIFRYWRNKKIDVTCEGYMYWLRNDPFIGLQAMTWHYNEINFLNSNWENKPNQFSTLPSELCEFSPMHAELAIMKDPIKLSGLIEEFCLKVVPWYYKRNSDPLVFSSVIITENEVICPILWKEKTILAYSKEGFINKKLKLPSNYYGKNRVKIYDIKLDSIEEIESIPVENGIITFSLVSNKPILIMY